MEFREAIQKADEILIEERVRPTLAYEPSRSGGGFAEAFMGLSLWQRLTAERKQRPRRVHESPNEFAFKSTNYELLLALYSQLHSSNRDAFAASVLSHVVDQNNTRVRQNTAHFPSWDNRISELPLVAEFCIRVGYKRELFRVIAESALTKGLVVMLMQLEDGIALNFNIFSDGELEHLARTVSNLRAIAYPKSYQFGARRGSIQRARNPNFDPDAREIVAICDGISEECRQARYFYLKGALQQNANLEINRDKRIVEQYLQKLGFSGPLLEVLNAAEQDFRESATPFELKNSLAHLRSFLEGLHEQASGPLAMKAGVPAPTKWGKTTEMLRKNGVLSQQEEALATSLYTLISDEGVHPLMAEREYARLLRNMVIEYGLMFLTKADKAGISLK